MKVFISYSHYDGEIARRVYKITKGRGLEPVLDEKVIAGGEIIDEKVKALLAQSQILIVVISPSSVKSPWVFYEIGRADDAGRIIVPYLTHPGLASDLPIFLQKRKYFTSIEELDRFLASIVQLRSPDSYLMSLYLSGLRAVYKSRSAIPNYFEYFVRDATSDVRAIFVSGNFFSAVTFENIIRKKPEVSFRLLLFNPKLVDIRNQDLAETQYRIQPSEWDTVLSTVCQFTNMRVRLYDEYPFWHLIIIDDRICVVSFNPIGRLGYNTSPVYVLENNKQDGNLFSAFSQYYEILWRTAKEPEGWAFSVDQ